MSRPDNIYFPLFLATCDPWREGEGVLEEPGRGLEQPMEQPHYSTYAYGHHISLYKLSLVTGYGCWYNRVLYIDGTDLVVKLSGDGV